MVFINLHTFQAADDRHDVDLYQKDEEMRKKDTQLEQVQVKMGVCK